MEELKFNIGGILAWELYLLAMKNLSKKQLVWQLSISKLRPR